MSLDSSESFVLSMTGITMAGALVGVVLQFLLKSRCTRLQCGPCSCERDVLPASQVELDTSSIPQ